MAKNKRLAQAYDAKTYADLARSMQSDVDGTGMSYRELAAMLDRPNTPVHSVGQGLVEAGGKIGSALLMKGQREKEQTAEKDKYRSLAEAMTSATSPTTRQDLNVVQDKSDPSYEPIYGDIHMTPQGRGNMAMQSLAEKYPELAVKYGPQLLEMAQSIEPEKFSGELSPGQSAWRNGQVVASVPAAPKEKPRAQSQLGQIAADLEAGVISPADAAAEREKVLRAPPAPGTAPKFQTFYTPDGQEMLDINDEQTRAKIAAGGYSSSAPSDGEQAAKGFLGRMTKAEANLAKVMEDHPDYTPGNEADSAARGIPVIGNRMVSDAGQLYRQAQEDWVRAKLRKESGATIPDSEMDKEIATYFPVAGDRPETLAQKKSSRIEAERQVATQAGILGRKRMKELDAPSADPKKPAESSGKIPKFNPATGEFE
jgi:hypothetical protein